jgi:hypothetical protein
MLGAAGRFMGLSAQEWANEAIRTTIGLGKSTMWGSRMGMFDDAAAQVDVIVAVWTGGRERFDILPIKVRPKASPRRPWIRLTTKALAIVCRDEAEARQFARRYG